MNGGFIELDASGSGYTLSLTGVPAASCRHCRTTLTISETGEMGLDSLIVATVEALETLAPIAQGELRFLSMHCRKCMSALPKKPDKDRGRFRANAYLGTTGTLLGVEYYGQSFTCPKCMVKHPHLPSPLYHKVKDSLTRAARNYLPR
jgi:hypothetical protein